MSVSSNVKAKDRTLKSIGVEDGGGGGARAFQTKQESLANANVKRATAVHV